MDFNQNSESKKGKTIWWKIGMKEGKIIARYEIYVEKIICQFILQLPKNVGNKNSSSFILFSWRFCSSFSWFQ